MRGIDYAHDRPTDAELNSIATVKSRSARDPLTVDQRAVEALQIGDCELLAGRMPFIESISVDLPAPDGPSMPTNSLG